VKFKSPNHYTLQFFYGCPGKNFTAGTSVRLAVQTVAAVPELEGIAMEMNTIPN
jgi:hypothetical protein